MSIFMILRSRYPWILGLTAATVVATVAVTLLIPKMYTATTSIVIDVRSNDPFGKEGLPSQLSSTYMGTQVDILASRRVAFKVVDRLRLTEHSNVHAQFRDDTGGQGSIREWVADLLRKHLKVKPSRDSRVIVLEFSSPDPKFSAMVAAAFAESYIETTLELSVEPARQNAQWFTKQLDVLRGNLEDTRRKLTKFQQENGIVAADERLDTEMARLQSLATELVAAQAKSRESTSRQTQMEHLLTNQASLDALPEVLESGFIQGLKSELVKQQAKLDELSGQVGQNHPLYRRAQAEIESLGNKLRDETLVLTRALRNDSRMAAEREKSIKAAVANQKDKVLGLKRQHDEIAMLNREVENAQYVYDAALQRFNQINLESQVNQTNAAVLVPATVPSRHSHPKATQNIAISAIAGFVIAVLVALLVERVDRRVRTDADIVDTTGIPIIARLSHDKKSARIHALGTRSQHMAAHAAIRACESPLTESQYPPVRAAG